MIRRLYQLITGVSLLLSLAVACLWIRSTWWTDTFGYETAISADDWQRGGTVESLAGTIRVEWWLRKNPPHLRSDRSAWEFIPRRLNDLSKIPRDTWHGFRYLAWTYDNAQPRSDAQPTPPLPGYSHFISVAVWLPLLIFLILPAFELNHLIRIRRAKRRAANMLCPRCGYDLRASPDRCPECGEPTAASAIKGD